MSHLFDTDASDSIEEIDEYYTNVEPQWFEVETGERCQACYGSGQDRDFDADCMVCYGEGYV